MKNKNKKNNVTFLLNYDNILFAISVKAEKINDMHKQGCHWNQKIVITKKNISHNDS